MNSPYVRPFCYLAISLAALYAILAQALSHQAGAMFGTAALAFIMARMIGGIRPAYWIIWGGAWVIAAIIYLFSRDTGMALAPIAAACLLTLKFAFLFGDRPR